MTGTRASARPGAAHRLTARATVGMGEHVGDAAYPAFAAAPHRPVRRGGRVLVHQMPRGRDAPGGGPFIEAGTAPDLRMRPLGETVGLLAEAGPEARHVESPREYYVRTVTVRHRAPEERRERFVGPVGEETARGWRLYLVGGAPACEEGRMGVDQILSARPGPGGDRGTPAAMPAWNEGVDRL